MNVGEIKYDNLEGLLLTCLMANLVTVNPEKKSWEITRKFVKIIDGEIRRFGVKSVKRSSSTRSKRSARTKQT